MDINDIPEELRQDYLDSEDREPFDLSPEKIEQLKFLINSAGSKSHLSDYDLDSLVNKINKIAKK